MSGRPRCPQFPSARYPHFFNAGATRLQQKENVFTVLLNVIHFSPALWLLETSLVTGTDAAPLFPVISSMAKAAFSSLLARIPLPRCPPRLRRNPSRPPLRAPREGKPRIPQSSPPYRRFAPPAPERSAAREVRGRVCPPLFEHLKKKKKEKLL